MAFLRGTVDRVEPPNEYGWAKVYVTAEGHEKPVRIDTNKQAQMREAVELRDAGAYINLEYDEQTKRDAERGRTYVNRYWVRASRTSAPDNGGGQWGGPSDAPVPQPNFNAPTPEFGRPTNPRDAWRMSLAKSVELAILTLPYLPVEQRTPANQREIALYWARFIYLTEPLTEMIGPPPARAYSAATNPSTDAASGTGYESAPWPSDDDIPF